MLLTPDSWKGDALQRAMDVRNGCFAADCGNQKSQTIDSANRCQITKKVREEVDGCKLKPEREVMLSRADLVF
jgi:hypothetical protein